MPISTAWRCMHVTESTVQVDADAPFRTPEGSLDSLAVLLGRIQTRLHRNGATVILGDRVHELMGLPRYFRKAVADHPALVEARQYGWEVAELSPWMTFRRHDAPNIHVGIDPWLKGHTPGKKDGNFALKDPKAPALTLMRMVRFYEWLGVPFYGTNAGLPGIDLLRDHHKGETPFWCPKNWADVEPAGVPTEVVTTHWKNSSAHDLPYEHQFDAALQFLSAAISGDFATTRLYRAYVAPSGWITWRDATSPFDPSKPLPGYYQVTVPPWPETRIPHPMGDTQKPGEKAWITGATLALVHELANVNHPLIEFPEIHDAWVGNRGRVLRPWGETVRDAERRAREYGDQVLLDAVKDVYKAGIGMMADPEIGRVRRPDWQHTIIGLARSNFWRKIRRYATSDDVWPVEIDRDSVWYAGPQAEPEWPSETIFPRRLGPGGFQHKGTREVTR